MQGVGLIPGLGRHVPWAKPMRYSYWACALEPRNRNSCPCAEAELLPKRLCSATRETAALRSFPSPRQRHQRNNNQAPPKISEIIFFKKTASVTTHPFKPLETIRQTCHTGSPRMRVVEVGLTAKNQKHLNSHPLQHG